MRLTLSLSILSVVDAMNIILYCIGMHSWIGLLLIKTLYSALRTHTYLNVNNRMLWQFNSIQ